MICQQSFDGFHDISSGDSRAFVPGVGLLVESWSGYALARSGTNVPPWIVPAVDPASGHTNLTCDASRAIRFYFEPFFSSASVSGGTGPGATARLADLVAGSSAGTAVVWSLQISADGTVLQLLGYSDSGPAQLLSAPIAWQARHYHLVALDYGPQGTALFIDGQLAAQGGGSVAIPASVGSLVLGSSIAGTDTAHGAFDEFFSFDHALTAGDIAFYYQFTGATAALGPISDEEEEALFALAATSQMALPRVYDPNHDITCSPGGPVYITNVFATLQADGTMTFSFDIQGGTNGVLYDIFTATCVSNSLTSHQWNWIGQGMTCNTYSFSNQPPDLSFYVLGVPVYTMTVALGNNGSGQCNVPEGTSNSMAVAGGGYFSLALQNDGTILAWGDNAYGETSVPSGITNAVAVAAGQFHGLALLTNGTVTNWGSFWDGATNYPVTNYPGLAGPPTSNVMAIAAGAGHDLALLSNGTVVCWGLTNLYATDSNALAFQTNLTGVKAIACGWNHNVALLSNGVVEAWGLNASNLAWSLTNVPADLTNAVAIAAFGLHSLALRADGTVEGWGYSPYGETNVPAGLTNVVAIAAGGFQSLALQAGGTTLIWGMSSLTNIPGGVNAGKTIAGGFQHNLVLQSDLLTPLIFEQPMDQFAPAGSNVMFSAQGEALAGVQYQWQFDGTNIMGATNSTLTLTNVQATNEGSYQAIVSTDAGSTKSTVATFTLVVAPEIVSTSPAIPCTNWLDTGVTLSVGVNAVGQSQYPVGYQWQLNGTNIAYTGTSPDLTIYPSATADGLYLVWATNVAGSNSVTWDMRVSLPGMVEAWGADGSGQIDRPVGLTNAAGIAAGEYQSIAVTDSGTVVQWGQYSDGTNFFSVTNLTNCSPPPSSNVVAVAAGLGQALALMANGSVSNWGLNGAFGNSVPTNITHGVKAVACGDQFDLVLLTNGTVAAWGYGGTNGSLTNVPSSVTNAIAIAAGAQHSLALLSDGTVVAWGYNPGGETNVPAGLTNVVAIAAGAHHSLALVSTNGTVVAWGTNNFGQTTVPAGLSNVLAIAAGANHSVALSNDSATLVEWGYNSSGQATVPLNNPTTNILGAPYITTNIVPASTVKLIAAGGNHTMASIWSPLVQYPVDVTKDLLLIYNTHSLDSSNVCAYYLANRPMIANCTNVLAIGCTTNETTYPTDFTNDIEVPIQNWLSTNPTKRPAYLILFQDIPSRANNDVGVTNSNGGIAYDEKSGTGTPSVQYQRNQWCAPNWHPFATSINMNGTGGTNDCIAYINKLAFIGTNYSQGHLILSASKGGYGNSNYYFDDTEDGYGGYATGMAAEQSLVQVGVSSNSIVYTNINPDCGSLACHIIAATNVAGYLCWGEHSSLGAGYATNGTVQFSGHSTWFIMETIESFNGQRDGGQGNFLSWFAANAFGGTNYSNTPMGAPSNVNEPGVPGVNYSSVYFGLWAIGKNAAICAWNARNTPSFQVVGDPLVTR